MPRHKVTRAIVPTAIRVGDMISVRFEIAGVVYQSTAYVGKLERHSVVNEGRQREVWRAVAANGTATLVEFSGDDVYHPYRGARVYLERAAPETHSELEGMTELHDDGVRPRTGPIPNRESGLF